MDTFDKTIEELTIKYNSEKDFFLQRKKSMEYEVYLVLVGQFPFVEKIRMDFSSIIIYTTSGSQFPNEITINNSESHKLSGEESYSPELSVSSLRVKSTDKNTLDQMILLGYLAQEMKNIHSLLFGMFSTISITLDKLDAKCRKISREIETLKTEQNDILKRKEKESFDNNFKEGNYYLHTYVGRTRTQYKFIKIIKISPKTISYIITEYVNEHTVKHLLTDNYDFNRMKIEDKYQVLRSFKLSSIEEIQKCVNNTLGEIEATRKTIES